MLLCISFLSSCIKDFQPSAVTEGPVRVYLSAGESGLDSKTSVCPDGVSVSWDNDDAVYLWAKAEDGTFPLACQKFELYGQSGSEGVFSTMLAEPMADGSYLYAACCPEPETVSGTALGFNVPSVQDGTGSCDVLVAGPVAHGPLSADAGEGFAMGMRHLAHLLDFYLVDDDAVLDGEAVRSIEVSMARSVSGGISADVMDGAVTYVPGGTNGLVLDLDKPLAASTASRRYYASAVVLPFAAGTDESMKLTIRTENKVATTDPIPLGGRTFAAGHATPVKIVPAYTSQIYNAYFTIAVNNLGEDIRSIHITGPDGCRFGDGGTNEWTCTPEEAVALGGQFTLSYTDEADFMSISGRQITVEFESVNAVVSSKATIPSISGTSCNTNLTVPYLYFEDFSATTTSNEYDSTRGTGSTSGGSNNSVDLSTKGWPYGWYGARCGIKAGDKIRLTTRSESVNVIVKWSGSYNGRIDSPAMSCIKEGSSGVRLKIEFDYSSGWTGNKSNKGNFYLAVGTHQNAGAVNTVGAINNIGRAMDGDSVVYEDIEFVPGSSKLGTSTFPEATEHFSCTTPQLCTKDSRIAWETYLKTYSGDGYYNYWVFIDNIRISIAK